MFKALRDAWCIKRYKKTTIIIVNILSFQLDCTIYGDNAGLSLVRETLKEPSPDARADILELNGVFDYILYLSEFITHFMRKHFM